MKNKRFYGTVYLYDKGKCYGATTRQVNAKNKADARKVLKKNFKFGNNKVIVKNIKSHEEVKKMRKK